jgi:hypothetical protein
MGLFEKIFGRKMWTTSEKTKTRTESEFGKTRTTAKEITTERDSRGNTISKTTTTQETERD